MTQVGLTFDSNSFKAFTDVLAQFESISTKVDKSLKSMAVSINLIDTTATKVDKTFNNLVKSLHNTQTKLSSLLPTTYEMASRFDAIASKANRFGSSMDGLAKDINTVGDKLKNGINLSAFEKTLADSGATGAKSFLTSFDKGLSSTSIVQAVSSIGDKVKTSIGNLNITSVAKDIGLQFVSGLTNAIKSGISGLSNIISSAFNGIRSQFNSLISGLRSQAESDINSGLNRVLTGGIASLASSRVIQAPLTQSLNFESSLINTQAVAGFTDEIRGDIEGEVFELAINSRLDPNAVADIRFDITSAIADPELQKIITAQTVKLAEAGRVPLEAVVPASDALINLTNAYGSAAEDIPRLSDTITRAVQTGKGTLPQFAQAISATASIAKTAGVPVEDLSASIALLTTRGASASEASTQTQGFISALLKPSIQLDELLNKAGFSSGSGALGELGLVGTAERLMEVAGNSDVLAKAIGRVDGLKGALALGTGGQDFFKFFNDGLDGATDLSREAQLNSTQASIDNLKSAFSGFGIVLASNFLPIIKEVADGVADITRGVIEWAQENPQLAQTITLIVAGGALLVSGLITLNGVMLITRGLLLGGLASGLQGVATILFNPLGIIAGFGALAVAVGAIVAVGAVVSLAISDIQNNVGGAGDAFERAKSSASGFMQSLSPLATQIGKIISLFGDMFGAVTGFGSETQREFSFVTGILNSIADTIDSVVMRIQQATSALGAITGIADVVLGRADPITADDGQSIQRDAELESNQEKIRQLEGQLAKRVEGGAGFDVDSGVMRKQITALKQANVEIEKRNQLNQSNAFTEQTRALSVYEITDLEKRQIDLLREREGLTESSLRQEIKAGDTIEGLLLDQGYALSEIYGNGGALEQFQQLNNLGDSDQIIAGQSVTIPTRLEVDPTRANEIESELQGIADQLNSGQTTILVPIEIQGEELLTGQLATIQSQFSEGFTFAFGADEQGLQNAVSFVQNLQVALNNASDDAELLRQGFQNILSGNFTDGFAQIGTAISGIFDDLKNPFEDLLLGFDPQLGTEALELDASGLVNFVPPDQEQTGLQSFVSNLVSTIGEIGNNPVIQLAKETLTGLGESISQFFTNLDIETSELTAIATGLLQFGIVIVGIGAIGVKAIIDGIAEGLPALGTGIGSIVDAVALFAQGDISGGLLAVKDAIVNFASGFAGITFGTLDSLLVSVESLTGLDLGFIRNTLDNFQANLQSFFDKIEAMDGSGIIFLAESIGKAVGIVGGAIGIFMLVGGSAVLNGFGDVLNSIADGLTSLDAGLSKLQSGDISGLTDIASGLTEFVNLPVTFMKGIAQDITLGIEQITGVDLSGLRVLFESMANFIKNPIEGVIDFLQNALREMELSINNLLLIAVDNPIAQTDIGKGALQAIGFDSDAIVGDLRSRIEELNIGKFIQETLNAQSVNGAVDFSAPIEFNNNGEVETLPLSDFIKFKVDDSSSLLDSDTDAIKGAIQTAMESGDFANAQEGIELATSLGIDISNISMPDDFEAKIAEQIESETQANVVEVATALGVDVDSINVNDPSDVESALIEAIQTKDVTTITALLSLDPELVEANPLIDQDVITDAFAVLVGDEPTSVTAQVEIHPEIAISEDINLGESLFDDLDIFGGFGDFELPEVDEDSGGIGSIFSKVNDFVSTDDIDLSEQGVQAGISLGEGVDVGLEEASASGGISVFTDAIIAQANAGFGIESPSVIFQEMGLMLTEGLLIGMEEGSESIIELGQLLSETFAETFDNVLANGVAKSIASLTLFDVKLKQVALFAQFNLLTMQFGMDRFLASVARGISVVSALQSAITGLNSISVALSVSVGGLDKARSASEQPLSNGARRNGGVVRRGGVYEFLESGLPFELGQFGDDTYLFTNQDGYISSPANPSGLLGNGGSSPSSSPFSDATSSSQLDPQFNQLGDVSSLFMPQNTDATLAEAVRGTSNANNSINISTGDIAINGDSVTEDEVRNGVFNAFSDASDLFNVENPLSDRLRRSGA